MAGLRKQELIGAGLGPVLIVEDDAVLALAIDAALRNLGVRDIVTCASTATAMQALDDACPDVVVLDVHLADRDDGWALAELIDLLGPRRPRIVFSTGTPDEIPPKIATMGDIFAKPYDPADLARALCMDGGGRPGILGRLRAVIP